MLLGNKCDNDSERAVGKEMGDGIAKEHKIRCVLINFFCSYGKVRSQLSAETFGTYHLMEFCTLALGRARFQLYRPILGMVV